MRQLPDKMRFNLDRPKLEAYIIMCENLINEYKHSGAGDMDKMVLVLLERIRMSLKKAELKLQNHFNMALPVEQCLALYIALKGCGGMFHHNWLSRYYDGLIMQLDPILQ